MTTDSADAYFVQAIVEMCRGLKIRTVAEYVENEHVLDAINQVGVDFVQGYYVGMPEPLDVYLGDRFAESNEDIRKSFVFTRGRLHELPEGIILMVPTRMVPFALSSLMSWPGKLRMGMDLVLPRGGASRGGRAGGDESLGDFVRRRLGKEALARIAEPIVAGIHAGDPEQMSVRATFPMFLDMEKAHRSLILAMLKRRKARQKAAAGAAVRPRPEDGPHSYFYSFKGGLQDLSDSLVASLPAERLHGGSAVRTMSPLAPEPAWAPTLWSSATALASSPTPWCWPRRPGRAATCCARSRRFPPPTCRRSTT